MKKILFTFFFLVLSLSLPNHAFAENGSYDISNLNFTQTNISFDFSNVSNVDLSTVIDIGVLCNGNWLFPPIVSHNTGTFTQSGNHINVTSSPYDGSVNNNCHIALYGSTDAASRQIFSVPLSIAPTPLINIESSPSSGNKTVGTPFNVDVKVTDTNGSAFNAARATVAVSSNLSITGIHNPSTNACNFNYTQAPTTANPSFAGAIFGGSSTGCTVYTLTLTPTSSGTGTISFTNGSIKAYADNSEILTGVTNGSFTIADGPTPTPTPNLSLTINNILPTYHSSYTLSGTKLDTLTHLFVNGSETNSTYPTSTTWQNTQTLVLGSNNFAIYGSDNSNNQTATQTISVSRHTLGDINGDGVVDLTDASLFAVDWDKTSNLTYNLSDMNDDGNVDLTDLSILAKLEQ